MTKYKHLSLDNRMDIEKYLGLGLNFSQIGRLLNKSDRTIAFEVNNDLATKPEELAGAYQKCKTAQISNMRDIEDFMRDGDD